MTDIRKRPGTLTFVAIVLFAFSAVYIFSSLSSGFWAIVVATSSPPANANAKVEPGDVAAAMRFVADQLPGYVAIALAIASLDFFFAIGLLICGINILRLTPWARTGTILLILVRLAYILGYDVFKAVMLLPIELDLAKRHVAEMPQAGQAQAEMELVLTIMNVAVYAIFGVQILVEVFASLLIVLLLSTTKAKNAFAGVPDEPERTLSEDRQQGPSKYAGYEDETGIVEH
jgi:hypothetical protein